MVNCTKQRRNYRKKKQKRKRNW